MKTITLRINIIAVLALAALFSVCELRAADPKNWIEIQSIQPSVSGIVEGEPAVMSFHVNAKVFDDGKATGTIQIRVVGGESFLYRIVRGQATVEDGTLGEAMLTVERVGEDGASTGETDQVIVRPSSTIVQNHSEDCFIYDIQGNQVRLEAPSTFRFFGRKVERP